MTDDKVTTYFDPFEAITYELTREHWTPYEPWMRDVLADDARVSWVGYVSGSESRLPWLHCKPVSLDWLPDRDARIHPDDVPERPAEDDPDEALSTLVWTVVDDAPGKWEHGGEAEYVTRSTALAIARAAREHIEAEREVGEPAPADVDPSAIAVNLTGDHWCEGEGCAYCDSHTSTGQCKYPRTCEIEKTHATGAADVDPDEALADAHVWHIQFTKEKADREKAEAEIADERDRHNATLIERERLLTALADMTRQRDKYATQAEKWQARHATW